MPNVVCFAKKSVNKKPYILVWTIFSLANRHNFKEAIQNVWRATIFGQATKSLVSWQAQPILRRVILFRQHYPEKPLWGGNNRVCMYQSSFKWRFLLYEKFHVSHMRTRLQKRKISDNNIFNFFLQTPSSIFRRSSNRAQIMNLLFHAVCRLKGYYFF